MEINVLCFSIYGNQEQTAWAGITIEDGDTSSFSGLASSELEAILFGLYECLESLPSATPIMIRCSERLPNEVGKKCIPQWKAQGFEHEEYKEDIRILLALLQPKKCLWSKPVLVNEIDRLVQKQAKERFAQSISSPKPSSPQDELLSETAIPIPPDIVSEPAPEISSFLKAQSNPPSKEEAVIPNISEEQPPPKQELILNKEAETISPPPIPSSPSESKPLVESQETEVPLLLFQAQILVYVDAISTGDIGAWGFLLIDRKSQHALLKGSGHRHSHLQTNLLQACISSLQSLRSPDFLIEIRSRHQSFIQLGQQWLPLWAGNSWRKRNGEEPANLPFLQELHRVLQTMTPSWRYIPEEAEEKGLIDCHNITQQALNQLNYGGKAQLERRIPQYSLEQLL